MSLASCMVVGSSRGMPAEMACQRESNSLVEEWALGSSLETITRPPFTPAWAAQWSASAVHKRPFCFTTHRARPLARDAPVQACRAQTSLVDHSA